MPGGKNLKHTVTCHVRVDPNSSVTDALKEVWRHVNLKMEGQHHTKVLLKNENEKWRDEKAITLIICPVSSRLASNAKHAMKGIEGHKNMALVFLHHVASHVPFYCNSESVLMDAEYMSLGAMIDVVFFHGKGVYECPANTQAIHKFCEFLKDRIPKENGSASNRYDEDTLVDSGNKKTEVAREESSVPGTQNQDRTYKDNQNIEGTPIDSMDNNHTVTCYVRGDPNSSVTDALKEVWRHVNLKMEGQHHTKVLLKNENEKWRDEKAITLIICPVSSRLASNAKHAMKGIEGHKNMALVFLHHVASHVPFYCNSESVLMDAEYMSLGAMIDVVFFHGKGVYECPANTQAIHKFCEFLKDRIPKENGSASNRYDEDTLVDSGNKKTEVAREESSVPGTQNQDRTYKDNQNIEGTPIDSMDNNHTVTCYVRGDPNSSVTDALKEVWRHVNLKMEGQHHTKVLLKNENEKWRDEKAITLIICPVSSRLASNAKHAMKGIEGHKNMALVFLHHVASHVPFYCNSESVLMDAEYMSLGAMIDVVFFHGKGVYECPANTQAIHKFCEFLKDRIPKENGSASNRYDEDTLIDSGNKKTEVAREESSVPGTQNQDRTYKDNQNIEGTPIDSMDNNHTVTCYVRGDHDSSVTESLEEVWRHVILKMEEQHHKKVLLKKENESWRDEKAITLILCPVSSRLASNAKHAMKGIEAHKNMALVFLHHVASHVPFNCNSESLLMNAEYTSLGAMIDVVFAQGEGVYDCPANRRAIDKLCEFLKDRSPKENVSASNRYDRGTPCSDHQETEDFRGKSPMTGSQSQNRTDVLSLTNSSIRCVIL